MKAAFVSRLLSFAVIVSAFCVGFGYAQTAAEAKKALGSKTAKDGFRNEDSIRDKFNNWQADDDAKQWLAAMGHAPSAIRSVTAAKPHGDKADVVVVIKTDIGEHREGISIKLVSGKSGFNQIDKRWLSQYVKMWEMPSEVADAMKLFLGEKPPTGSSRRPERMYLNELDKAAQLAIIDFFTNNKNKIVSDLIVGDGINKADWLMVISNIEGKVRWKIVRAVEASVFFCDGGVLMTRSGNLRIGRVSMQRKGGDGGRDTAKMLQFKLDPLLIFEMK